MMLIRIKLIAHKFDHRRLKSVKPQAAGMTVAGLRLRGLPFASVIISRRLAAHQEEELFSYLTQPPTRPGNLGEPYRWMNSPSLVALSPNGEAFASIIASSIGKELHISTILPPSTINVFETGEDWKKREGIKNLIWSPNSQFLVVIWKKKLAFDLTYSIYDRSDKRFIFHKDLKERTAHAYWTEENWLVLSHVESFESSGFISRTIFDPQTGNTQSLRENAQQPPSYQGAASPFVLIHDQEHVQLEIRNQFDTLLTTVLLRGGDVEFQLAGTTLLCYYKDRQNVFTYDLKPLLAGEKR